MIVQNICKQIIRTNKILSYCCWNKNEHIKQYFSSTTESIKNKAEKNYSIHSSNETFKFPKKKLDKYGQTL